MIRKPFIVSALSVVVLVAINASIATGKPIGFKLAEPPSPNSSPVALSPQTMQAPPSFELVSQTGGATQAVVVQDKYVYFGVGPRLVIMNVSDQAHPRVVGQTDVLLGVIMDVAIAGDYVYVADYSGGLRVINVANPSAPVEVGSCGTGGTAWRVAVAGNYAYVADYYSGLQVIDVTDPASPHKIADYYLNSIVTGVAVAGNYAYVADGYLRVFNTSDPASPSLIGTYDTPGFAQAVTIAGKYAYITGASEGLSILDVSNLAAPTLVGRWVGTTNSWDVTIAGSHAFVAAGWGLYIVNITDPTHPAQVGYYQAIVGVTDVAVIGGYAYLANSYRGLRILNVGNPVSPVEVGSYEGIGWANAVALASNGNAYIAASTAGLYIANVADPAHPALLGYYDTPGYATDVAVAGNYAYVADDSQGLRIINISNPMAPFEVGALEGSGVRHVVISGRYAYVADLTGLRVLDINAPASPTQVGFVALSGNYHHVAVAGNYAYVTDGWVLRIISINNPSNPTQVGYFDAGSYASHVYVAGKYAYVTVDFGWIVLDISNPATPTRIAYQDGAFSDLAVAGHFAYVVGGDLCVFDISDPTNAIQVGNYALPVGGGGVGLTASGSQVYIGDIGAGLFILRCNACVPPSAGFDASPRSGLSPLTVMFADQSMGVSTSWLWQFGDGTTSTLQNPVHTYMAPGTFTVTLTASGSGGSNTITRTNYIRTYLPQPILAAPICGTTNKVSPAISGLAPYSFTIAFYDDGLELLTTTATVSNTFALTPSLTTGRHVFTATATNATGTGIPSSPLVLTVTPTLPYDPVGVTFAYAASSGTVTQNPRDSSGCANPDGWRVWLRSSYTTTVAVPVSYTNSAIVTVTLGDQTRVVADVLGSLRLPLSATFTPPINGGEFVITVTADGQTVTTTGWALIDPDGYVYDKNVWDSQVVTQALPGVAVSCEYWDAVANDWMVWNAWAYNRQSNPQVTGADGYYSFFVPPGTYRIRASHADYWPYTSNDIVVVDAPARLNIPLVLTRRAYLPVVTCN